MNNPFSIISRSQAISHVKDKNGNNFSVQFLLDVSRITDNNVLSPDGTPQFNVSLKVNSYVTPASAKNGENFDQLKFYPNLLLKALSGIDNNVYQMEITGEVVSVITGDIISL